MNRIRLGWMMAAALTAAVAGAEEIHLDGRKPLSALADSYRCDLRPGLRITCRVKFDESPEEKGEMVIAQKGSPNQAGSFLLRVDGPKEGVKFSFFVNHDRTPEPRVSIPCPIKTGEWYDVAAGWDGTNSWLTVNGQTAKRRRPGKPSPVGIACDLSVGPMAGTIADLAVTGPAVQPSADTAFRPGFRLSCRTTFLAQPTGETTIAYKREADWLRYDKAGDRPGCFNFFVMLDGNWEPRASFQREIEVGRTYTVSAGWDGLKTSVIVDGDSRDPVSRTGRFTSSPHPLSIGTKGVIAVSDLCIRNEPKPIVAIGEFRTRELLPRLGAPAGLLGQITNIGIALPACTLEVEAAPGVTVSPTRIDLGDLDEYAVRPLAWTVDPGTNGIVDLALTLRQGQNTVKTIHKRLVFLPERDPDFSAKAWNPPVTPTRTYHVDAADGDDTRDGLSPETAWKHLAKAADLTLGPGERLLLKRGSVFNEELRLTARGTTENWAEIGAYGEGMRPQIRRNRFINDQCGVILNPAHLIVRDLIFCNAGSGFSIVCSRPDSGHILIERCLAHHIEGVYRFNSHGIPEWRDEKGSTGPGGRSCGIWAGGGSHPQHIVMRDCESYQCSSGFSVNGFDTFVTRMFCHDNYAHNTSPHPYNCASRSWMTDCLFDASGWHAAAGTMGVMLANNCGYIIRGCHFVNQPDSGSPDQGGIDFEAGGENCLVEACTFRNNAGAAIEVLGLRLPQTRNVHIRRCKFDRNNYARKNGPAEIQVWGQPGTPRDIACSNGLIEENGYVLIPGIPFYINESPSTNDWTLAANRAFDFPDELDRAFPYPEPPAVTVCGEVWTDRPEAALAATVSDPNAALAWEQTEGPATVTFQRPDTACTKVAFPAEGDYRVALKADNGTLWRTARTAVHVLPSGARTFKAWDFATNLDSQGWRAEGTGTGYEFLPHTNPFWNSQSHPVRLVCGDYLVVALKDTAEACLITPDEMNVGVICDGSRANTLRIKMQNHTTSRRMRLWWQASDLSPAWNEKQSLPFEVTPMDDDDAVYTVPLPAIGNIKQLKLAFSADGERVTGTCRIDYIWLGRLPSAE
ncbi:MAG: right-handed parallel beta-helix repeat-containing protein [Kiritimatiellae bacterium]|nr:right-handed parallel beta-helix repeat-containing protein [Kiritimatiellia bacterium]